MKIGIDCRLWNETGVGRYIRNLVEQLLIIDKSNEYILFVLSKDIENIKHEISNLEKNCKSEIKNWKLRPADIKWHTFEEQLKFPQILNKKNLDLMHFPYFSVPIFYNRPFIVTIHDLIMHHFSTGQASTHPPIIYGMKRLGYKYVINQAAKNAKKIIAVSNATKNEIIDNLKIKPEKIIVTYEGVDDKIRNNPKATNYKLQTTNYFLYIGNAFPHKNLDRLLDALKILDNDTKLILVGKEDYFYRRLRNKVQEMKLSDKVIFLQNVSDEELSGLYQNAKALILPSLMEGFGLPALEAMANNCLVLASDIPALHEVCGNAAIYFDPYNVSDMAEKMKSVLAGNNSNKKEDGLNRAKLFSWHKMAKETLKIYESCVGV